MVAFAKQLEGIKQLFADVDRHDERFALYGVDTLAQETASISIDEWGAMLGAVKARLRFTVGEVHRPGVNDTPAAVRERVLDCVGALDQLHAMLGAARSVQSSPHTRRDCDSVAITSQRRAVSQSHVSAVPVSTPPLLKRSRAAVANDW